MNTNTNSHVHPHFGGVLALMSGDPLLRRQPRTRGPIHCEMARKGMDQWTHAAFIARVQHRAYSHIRSL